MHTRLLSEYNECSIVLVADSCGQLENTVYMKIAEAGTSEKSKY